MQRILNILSRHKGIKEGLFQFCLANFPIKSTTQISKFKTILVKKGRLKEWRTYSERGDRIIPPIK